MTEGFSEPEKAGRPGLQAIAAVALFAVVVGALWAQKQFVHQKGTSGEPATCSASDDHLPARYLSGARLCTALNRPDMPALLGTSRERIETADGSGEWLTLAGGTKIAEPEATVTLETYSVKLTASYDDMTVSETGGLLGDARRTTVLGHPALLYSSPTFSIGFNLGGGKASTGPGGTARCLLVSRHGKDDGKGTYEVAIWRQDDVPPDDTALARVAEQVLPTVPGWNGH
ncbi:DUF6215 domain-containing protein [Streptomyces hyaluromycini]|uniref:DUF6215 domain-containing protein n=1 Tax=Streptomyces hyaluromycini TaxID=1377993 RepID=UPI000B5C9A32|nr:DUF6215 domain-containing protein [Streptomyces hyaluromycini]